MKFLLNPIKIWSLKHSHAGFGEKICDLVHQRTSVPDLRKLERGGISNRYHNLMIKLCGGVILLINVLKINNCSVVNLYCDKGIVIIITALSINVSHSPEYSSMAGSRSPYPSRHF